MNGCSVAPSHLRPATRPTLYFVGVSTGASSIRRIFPVWAPVLGLDGTDLVGIDLPLNASDDQYRRVVDFIRQDELSKGALVTTHKIDLFRACHDRFDYIDPLAALMSEISCISKRDGDLRCHAKDPVASGLAIDALIPSGYWESQAADLVCLGAGGSSLAIAWALSRPHRGRDRPRSITITDKAPDRVAHFERSLARFDTDMPFNLKLCPTAGDNDAVLSGSAPGSLVVNGTGLGKDAPGSPITDKAAFPERAIAWDLNYRGDLIFLQQADAQRLSRQLRVEDGWTYFLHGWTQVIAEVFDTAVPSSGPLFDELAQAAKESR